jgi:polysaccharide export outer membrane protein
MKCSIVSIIAILLISSSAIFAQDIIEQPIENGSAYLIGPGDKLVGKVMGEEEFNFEVVIDDAGNFELPFVDQKVVAKCRTQSQIKDEVRKHYSKFLRNPLLDVKVAERRKPIPVTVFGEVRTPQRVELRREARLLQLLAFAGGIDRENAAGIVRVVRTQIPMCADQETKDNWLNDSNGGLEAPARIYSLSSIEAAKNESNPIIYPGDLIVVEKAPPVYVIGEVNALREIKITQNGLSLSEALAQAGGFRTKAKKKDITIRRLKPNSKEREIISVNYALIQKGEMKDIMLAPEDIVIVDKTKKSIGQTILEIATGGVKSAANVLPQRVFY